MANLTPSPKMQFLDSTGAPLVGGKLYTYAAGTSTPLATYTDSGAGTPNANPVILDARGEADVWCGPSQYKFVLKDANDVLQWTVDNINGADTPTINSILATLAASSGSTLVGHLPEGTDAIATTVEEELNRRRVNVFRWMTASQIADIRTGTWYTGTTAEKEAKRSAMYVSLVAAESWQRTQKMSLYFPDGWYEIGNQNMPWRNTVSSSLLDYSGTALFCSPGVTFATVSDNGADVFQMNASKNLSVFGFPKLRAQIGNTATSGSNGCSVTNGWDNLYLEIHGYQLPRVDATTFVDGAKALTLQNGSTSNICGRLKAIVFADGCSEGFGFEPDLVTSLTKTTSVDVTVHAADCYVGVKFVAAEATGALSASMSSGVVVRGSATDCQHGVQIQRAHGIKADMEIISSGKTAANKRLAPDGVAWLAADTIVEGADINYAKNGLIRVHGNVGPCDYKVRLGGASAGLSGLNGATEYSDLFFDLGGTAATSNLLVIDSGGNTVKNSRIVITPTTAAVSDIPVEWTIAVNNNNISAGYNYTGSFTGTLTGCTTSPTGTIKYSVNGDVVTLEIPAITGTSNTTSATITGMPSSLYPSTTQWPLCITTDSGTNAISRMLVQTDGTLLLNYVLSSGFTAAGTKGIQDCTITYRRG